jgi:PAS domain S-box-containing protein
MIQAVPEPQALPTELVRLIDACRWPLIVAAPSGIVLAASRPLRDLLGADVPAGTPLELLLHEDDRPLVRAALHAALAAGEPATLNGRLAQAGGTALAAELEISGLVGDALRCLPIIVYPESRGSRRERLLLGFNQLAPRLLAAQTFEEALRQVAEGLHTYGIEVAFALRDAGDGQLRLHYTDQPLIQPEAAGIRAEAPSGRPIRADTPGLREALARQRAVFESDLERVLRAVLSPPMAALMARTIRLQGGRGLIFAPLLQDEQVYGVVVVWGAAVDAEDLPLTETLANFLSAILTQIASRNRTATQLRRLNSLAITARAVTTLGALDDVLRAICLQTQQLLDADPAVVGLPSDDGEAIVIVMATGYHAEQLLGRRLPLDRSIFGRVTRTGRGQMIADVLADPDVYLPTRHVSAARALVCQPLQHQGRSLGVLAAIHPTPGHFTDDDLEYLGRYAEFAAVAVANAQLHAQLRESEQRARALMKQAEAVRSYLKALIDTAPNVLLTIDRDMTVHLLNPARLHVLSGYEPEEVEGQSLLRFIPPELHEQVRAMWRVVQECQPHSVELPLVRADGARLAVLVSAALVPEYGQVFVILNDMTERRALEARLRQNEKLAAQGRLVAGAAHELNNPLAIIVGLTQLQLMENLPPATREDLQGIERAALRASHIVEQLRTFARPPAAEPIPIALPGLVREALDRLQSELRAGGITVIEEYPPNLPSTPGDPQQLAQVFFNIVHNAVQSLATAADGRRRLTIRGWQEGAYVHMTIHDTGSGIQPQNLPRIFEPFFTTRDIGQGMGLGLAIVHAIIQQHSGRVWAESDPGRETIFHITLPIATTAPAPLQPEVQIPAAPAGTRILLVEDEADVQRVVARALELHGYTVDVAASGAEGLARARAGDYVLIITDLQMPELDGTTLYEHLHREQPGLRWLILTGDTMRESSRAFLERTGLAVLAKPFTREALLASVAACLG